MGAWGGCGQKGEGGWVHLNAGLVFVGGGGGGSQGGGSGG